MVELLRYFEPAEPGQAVRAVPGAGLDVAVWILGSSTYGAQLAAMLGLPYAFASHFAPAELEQALAIYRQRFQPSERLAQPRVMLGVNVIAADTRREARRLYSSLQQAFVALRIGTPGQLPPPVDDMDEPPRPRGQGDAGPGALLRGHRLAGDRRGGAGGLHRAHRGRRADDHRLDLRPRARIRSFEITARGHAAPSSRLDRGGDVAKRGRPRAATTDTPIAPADPS